MYSSKISWAVTENLLNLQAGRLLPPALQLLHIIGNSGVWPLLLSNTEKSIQIGVQLGTYLLTSLADPLRVLTVIW